MNARGDMMPKALNLTDMLWKRQEAERAQDAATKSVKRSKAEFIPEQPAPSDKASKSFQERVKESQARLSKKDHSFFRKPGPEAPEAKTPEARPADRAERQDRNERADRADRADRTGRTGRADRADRRDSADRAQEAATTERGTAPQKAAKVPGRQDISKADEARANGAQAGTRRAEEAVFARPEGLDATDQEAALAHGDAMMIDADALQARLEELGIEATPEQLEDPAFLAEMLWMIDSLPLIAMPLIPGQLPPQALPADAEAALDAAPGELSVDPKAAALPSAASADSANPAMAANPAVTAMSAAAAPEAAEASQAAAMSVPAEDFDWTAVEEPEREEIAALIREKLGTLAGKPELAGPEARPVAADPLANLQLVRAGALLPQEAAAPEASKGSDAPLADSERLRVLQTAAFAGPVADDRLALSTDPDMQASPDEEDADMTALSLPDAAHAGDREDGEEGQASTDLFGRDPAQARAAEAFAGREGAAARESAATPFQTAFEQVRAAEARAAAKASPLPQSHAAHEPAVMAQLARKLSALGGLRGNEEIRLQLEPEHLGRVRINIEMRGEGLTARIGVENDDVRRIMESNIANLKETLEGQGIKIQGMEVSVEHRNASLFNPDGSNARDFFRSRGQAGTVEAGGLDASDDAVESETGRRLGYNTMEYIA